MEWAAALVAGLVGGFLLGRVWRGPEPPAPAPVPDEPTQTREEVMMGTLGSGLAHELKTPLSTLQINLQLLSEEWQDAQTERERRTLSRVQTLQRSVSKIDTILDSFVRFSKDLKPQTEPTQLHDLVREVLESELPEVIETRGLMGRIQVAYDFRGDLPKVRIDRSLIRQVIVNLLLNAIESIEGEGKVTISCGRSGSWAEVAVSDTGKGIAPDHREKIWDMYFTTKPSGIGLGLPIARRIIEAHGGRIELADSGGTTFRVLLPIQHA